MKQKILILWAFVLGFASVHLTAAPVGTSFTYQGRLTDGGNSANGRYDFECAVYDALSAGTQIGGVVTNFAVAVSNGLFAVSLDFGNNVFTGNARWLEINVRSNGLAGSFVPLNPRQLLTPTPYALYAGAAGTVTNGAIQIGQLGTAGAAPAAGQILSYNGSSLAWQTPGGANLWSLNGGSAYYNGGNVGIGTTTPTEKLHVNGRFLRVEGDGGEAGYIGGDGVGGEVQIGSLNPNISKVAVYNAANGTWMDTYTGPLTSFGIVNATSDLNVNGQLTAAGPVAISGNVQVGKSAFSASGLNEFTVEGILDLATRGTRTRLVVKQNGNVGIGRASPQAKLDVNGDARVSVLTITGGSDVAEPFQMSTQEIPKGAVVVIDEENPGKLKLSRRAYDSRVAGIISGANGINPGIALHQEGALEGGQNVALSGRVYVQADASSSPIRPGDLLTTSNTPGHAMKVTDGDKAQGAIIGKAMSSLTSGQGMVLVLVTLQ